MTTFEKTHLEILDEQATIQPNSPVFWLPLDLEPKAPAREWTKMTYGQLRSAVFAAKKFYESQLKLLDIPKNSVIGLWLSGNSHTDLIHTLGVSAAGCIPQLFSLMYSHSPVVFELLIKSGAKALVCDPQSTSGLSDCPVPVIDANNTDLKSSEAVSGPLSDRPFAEVKDDVAIILHSSGSTAKIPKLIPWTHRYISSFFQKSGETWSQDHLLVKPVSVRVGNFNHAAAIITFMGYILRGDSIIMPSSLAFSSTELINMIHFCGLNTLTQLASILVPHLERAQNDPELLSALKSLSAIMYGGSTLPAPLEAWAYSAGLRLVNIFGSTECGVLMISASGSCPSTHLRLLTQSAVSHKLVPVEGETRLLELVVLSDSNDCPHSSLLDSAGHFHTGDLFELVEDGHYIFRGRTNDWIKCGIGMLCDTKAIEEAIKDLCKDIVADCVVVGANRRCPALLVEPMDGANSGELPKVIIERLSAFNKARFAHERVDDPGLVLVVGHGDLPRTATKGNIRRKAAEEAFVNELDEMYRVTGDL